MWPFVLMAVLAVPTGWLSWLLLMMLTHGGNPRWLADWGASLIGTLVVLGLLVSGIVFALRQSRANEIIRAQGPQPPPPIGRTTEGQPIYPVVGYTSDGQPVTADRAVGVQPGRQGTSGTAISALILAFVFPIVGVVLGFVARSQIKRTGQAGDGLALGAIIIGLIWTFLNIIMLIVVLGNLAGGH